MTTLFHVALGIHILSVLGIVGMLLSQARKSPRKLSAGVLHAAWSALIAGIVMIGLFNKANPDETLNHAKFGLKGLVLAAILTIGYRNVKKPSISNGAWMAMLGLTILNFVIVYTW
jgi:hypothetical protein